MNDEKTALRRVGEWTGQAEGKPRAKTPAQNVNCWRNLQAVSEGESKQARGPSGKAASPKPTPEQLSNLRLPVMGSTFNLPVMGPSLNGQEEGGCGGSPHSPRRVHGLS